jgi:cob(I)alamin adenosyltransferase
MTTKIYTRKGDQGKTNLYDIKGVSKNEDIFDVLGDLDELSAHIGHLCSLIGEESDLRTIQLNLLNIGAELSMMGAKQLVKEEDVLNLEKKTDYYNDLSPKLTQFILQGSSQKDAVAHICRTVCRRVERRMWQSTYIKHLHEQDMSSFKYVNRLSSFLFAFARYLSEGHEITRNMYEKKI